MPIDRTQLPTTYGITATLGIGGKTITSIYSYRHGSVEVLDILCTDAVHYFIKGRSGCIEVGGTAEWGSGKQIGGR